MAAGPTVSRNQDATIYVGGFDEKVTEEMLWELFLQAGRIVNVHLPKDRISQAHQGYGFVELCEEADADYAVRIMNMIKLYGKPIRVNKASSLKKTTDIGANIFIGNLDPEVDEKQIYDTFSAFGVILQVPKIARDPETGNSQGFGFVNFGSFEASDAAIAAMHGQYLCNRAISVSYAYRRDGQAAGQMTRHGSAAERLLAANNPATKNCLPNQFFADAPPLPLVAPPLPPPTQLVAPPVDATSGQQAATQVAPVPPPCGLVPPPPPPPPCGVMTMKGLDPPPLGPVPPPPISIALQQALQSTPLSPLPPYPPMKTMLPPPPPPPPHPPIAFSPMSLPPPPLATLHPPQTPPPPPPQSSPSWNSFHQHLPPHMQPDHGRLGQLLPRLFVGLPPQCPLPAQYELPSQHFLNRLPGPCPGPNPLEQRSNNFMQGDRPCPPFWNDCQDSRRR
ncbi:splicing factor 3B subunit 4 [Nilaparvata lugens]|uniref:splicing factor 3B subunit 4 n=1 Tax=Nilaparvata lugens TaxID=108931 RepID=UPI00193E0DD5|nr:splicing factor 3B subunit 4 [Nilaparvata lugens]